jgi:hypothetical protein
MSNNANMGTGAKPPAQFINKSITETIVVGPDYYPRDISGNILKVVSTGDGKGDFSHSLTDRQVSMAVTKGELITYTRSYTIPVQNPKWVAAKGRENMNELTKMFGSMGGKRRTTRRVKRTIRRRKQTRRR